MTTIQEFNQIDGRISSLYHAAALKMGLSDSEFRILYTLAVIAPGYLQSALREATGMGRSTVNSALKKLEREGILTLSPGSGRHTCVSLTAQGHRLADRTVCRLIRLEDRIYAGWTSSPKSWRPSWRLYWGMSKYFGKETTPREMKEWRYIQGLLDKIRSTGMGRSTPITASMASWTAVRCCRRIRSKS